MTFSSPIILNDKDTDLKILDSENVVDGDDTASLVQSPNQSFTH